jgi:16S rRNA (guanine527-N7)-methyltransferase
VSRTAVATHISSRLAQAGVSGSDVVIESLGSYIELLARWNRRINLTAFDLDRPTDAAIDRLIVEPLMAARHVQAEDRVAVDLGSGGGSPAIPLKIAVPSLRLVLVEARTRKSAFLREAARALNLADVTVDTRRFDSTWPRGKSSEMADVVTMRAIRADRAIWRGLEGLLSPRGRVLWFVDGTNTEPVEIPDGWVQRNIPVTEREEFLKVLTRTAG